MLYPQEKDPITEKISQIRSVEVQRLLNIERLNSEKELEKIMNTSDVQLIFKIEKLIDNNNGFEFSLRKDKYSDIMYYFEYISNNGEHLRKNKLLYNKEGILNFGNYLLYIYFSSEEMNDFRNDKN